VRTALISDVHGNRLALEAVLAELDREGVEQVVCLGDALQGGPEPVGCLELLTARAVPTVLGNADAFALDPATAEGSSEPVTEKQLAARAWTRDRLSDEQAAVVAAWPLALDLDLGHRLRLLAFHATPRSYHPLLFPTATDDEFRATLGPVDAALAAGGHTHLQFVRRVGATTFVNPGSVGFGHDHAQPEDGFALDPWASYAVVTTGEGGLRLDLRRLAFDAREVAAALRSCGMPFADERAAAWERGAMRAV
jgi:predicted phosphodiesterase